MPLIFPNVAVLGLSHDSRFFDAGFQYASFKRLTIAGTVNDLISTFGITGIWTGTQGISSIVTNPDYNSLTLNGMDFGSGRIEAISFEPGIDVKTKGYQANLVVYDSGNLFNFGGAYYSGIDSSNFQYLQSLSEAYSFDKKLNGGYSYSHTASVQFVSGATRLNAIAAAQSLAKTLFTGANLGFAFYSGYTNKQGKRYITENYSLIDNACSFQETFDFDNDGGNYSAVQTVSVHLDDKGIATATENASIRGIENPNYQKAIAALNIEMTGSYLRCSGAVNFYIPSGAILVAAPTTQGRTIDIFNNNIGYTVVFNNSPTNLQTYFWDYTLQMNKQDGVSDVTENGSIIGRGENPTLAFDAAQNGFGIVKTGIAARCGGLFSSPFGPSTNYLQQKEESYSPVQSAIGYSYQYSNNPTLISNNGIRRMSVTNDGSVSVYSYNKLGIFNVAEIIQNNYQSTQGSNQFSVQLEGDKTVALADFQAAAASELNSIIPAGSDRYVGGASYSYNPNLGATDSKITWKFNTPANQTIVP